MQQKPLSFKEKGGSLGDAAVERRLPVPAIELGTAESLWRPYPSQDAENYIPDDKKYKTDSKKGKQSDKQETYSYQQPVIKRFGRAFTGIRTAF